MKFVISIVSGVDTKLGVHSLSEYMSATHKLISPFPQVCALDTQPVSIGCQANCTL